MFIIMSTHDIICLWLLFIPFAYTIYNKNVTLFQITTFNVRERALLYYIFTKNELVIFLNGITNEAAVPMDVVVNQCCVKFFEEKLRENDIEYTIVNNQLLIQDPEDLDVRDIIPQYEPVPNITNRFHTWDSIMKWVDDKVVKYPFIKKIKIAKTYERREVFVLKISSGKRNSAVFLLGGEEGRDRSSPAILLNFVDYLLEHKLHVELLAKHHDFYILPIFNPDGYQYSINHEWWWARNRRVYFPKKKCSNNSAIGINLDRNWFFSRETSDAECDPVFTGTKALSEEETAGLAKFLDKMALRLMAFINIRSFENLVTIPYGYTDAKCNNYPVLLDIITSVQERLKDETGNTFFYGTSASFFSTRRDTLTGEYGKAVHLACYAHCHSSIHWEKESSLTSYYINLLSTCGLTDNFSGNVADWVKKKLNTPIVYTFYISHQNYIFAGSKDIIPLTNQFTIMMKEVLVLANSIYSPLFAGQIIHAPLVTLIIIIVVIHVIINPCS